MSSHQDPDTGESPTENLCSRSLPDTEPDQKRPKKSYDYSVISNTHKSFVSETSDISTIERLPTYEDVAKYFAFLKESQNKIRTNTQEVIDKTVQVLEALWDKTGLPVKKHMEVRKKVKLFYSGTVAYKSRTRTMKQRKYMDRTKYLLFDISTCKCQLPEYPCDHEYSKCYVKSCSEPHITCHCRVEIPLKLRKCFKEIRECSNSDAYKEAVRLAGSTATLVSPLSDNSDRKTLPASEREDEETGSKISRNSFSYTCESGPEQGSHLGPDGLFEEKSDASREGKHLVEMKHATDSCDTLMDITHVKTGYEGSDRVSDKEPAKLDTDIESEEEKDIFYVNNQVRSVRALIQKSTLDGRGYKMSPDNHYLIFCNISRFIMGDQQLENLHITKSRFINIRNQIIKESGLKISMLQNSQETEMTGLTGDSDLDNSTIQDASSRDRDNPGISVDDDESSSSDEDDAFGDEDESSDDEAVEDDEDYEPEPEHGVIAKQDERPAVPRRNKTRKARRKGCLGCLRKHGKHRHHSTDKRKEVLSRGSEPHKRNLCPQSVKDVASKADHFNKVPSSASTSATNKQKSTSRFSIVVNNIQSSDNLSTHDSMEVRDEFLDLQENSNIITDDVIGHHIADDIIMSHNKEADNTTGIEADGNVCNVETENVDDIADTEMDIDIVKTEIAADTGLDIEIDMVDNAGDIEMVHETISEIKIEAENEKDENGVNSDASERADIENVDTLKVLVVCDDNVKVEVKTEPEFTDSTWLNKENDPLSLNL